MHVCFFDFSFPRSPVRPIQTVTSEKVVYGIPHTAIVEHSGMHPTTIICTYVCRIRCAYTFDNAMPHQWKTYVSLSTYRYSKHV